MDWFDVSKRFVSFDKIFFFGETKQVMRFAFIKNMNDGMKN